jgi:transmembrane protein DUF3566
MRAMVRTPEITPRDSEPAGVPRRTRVVVKRVDPWSVLKFSLLFYFCLMLIGLLALFILYVVLGWLGVLYSLSHTLSGIGFGSKESGFQFNGFWIFSRLFLIGVVSVAVWSLVNLFVALLYNLVSDVVGGIQITIAERR